MPTDMRRTLIEIRYYDAAQKYLRGLPLEHFMESTPQSRQREITLASLALMRASRPDFQLFNELLVQYPLPGKRRLGQVVPDNMVVLHDEPIEAEGSYDVPLQPVGPFWVLEYVSKSNRRKDYDDNMQKYERDLKVPYYLLFEPDHEELTLYRHTGKRFVSVKPNEHGRCRVEELDLEVALHDGWVRFWHQGELLPLPGEMQSSLIESQARLEEMTRHAGAETRRADALERELAEVRARIKNGKGPTNGK